VPIDPAADVRPDWWDDQTYCHLSAIEDNAFPMHWTSAQERNHPTLPILRPLLFALWSLGKTGGITDRHWQADEALRMLEGQAEHAASEARRSLSRITDRSEDDLVATSDYTAVRDDPRSGPPQAYLVSAQFTVRLPGYAGDTVGGTITFDEGAMDFAGNGPLAGLDLLGRMDMRAVVRAIEAAVERQVERPLPTDTAGPAL
jgi:hypothetical protein